ncbi:hypothetical protein L1987_55645 [Smallanthus sonchifolius]|uniref:Uncharacterized protein n=1 Tax=Smallanthus sonchifolius TaxID=185202 RepID=A0ACB9EAM1_9ASTR|nr:hypothetical protein L1987_55645 [Smallanthus sonchifolius]
MANNWWDSSSRTRPCLDSVSSVSNSINLFQDTQTAAAATTGGSTAAANTSLHMMGLGLPSHSLPQSLDWNQALFRGDEKSDSGFRNLLQDQENSLSSTTTNFSSDFKQINVRGFHLDQPMPDSDNESIITCQGLNSSFQNMDLYGTTPSAIMQSLFGSDNNINQQHQDSSFDQNQVMSYSLYQSSYGGINVPSAGGGGGVEVSSSNWPKFPPQPHEFGVNSPSKVQLPDMGGNQLHFANNVRFWNASGGVNGIRSSFFPSLQMQLPLSSFEDKPKITSKVVKESSTSESSSNKRPRNENQSTLQAFKGKKEKMGDRITALQQLVSPFGKTDTASVLTEAIDYITFLHEQVSVLSTPYMKNGAPILQAPDKPPEGPRQDLRSRGLCLVPVSSTFPVTQETTVDFWTPTFGGTFR